MLCRNTAATFRSVCQKIKLNLLILLESFLDLLLQSHCDFTFEKFFFLFDAVNRILQLRNSVGFQNDFSLDEILFSLCQIYGKIKNRFSLIVLAPKFTLNFLFGSAALWNSEDSGRSLEDKNIKVKFWARNFIKPAQCSD